MALRALAALLAACMLLAIADASLLRAHQSPPPDPAAEAPEKTEDGSYKSKLDACSACKAAATGSCAMYKSCVCYATNAFFQFVGIPNANDTANFAWACGNEGGSKYELCFAVNELYEDAFGDKIDPNNLKCP